MPIVEYPWEKFLTREEIKVKPFIKRDNQPRKTTKLTCYHQDVRYLYNVIPNDKIVMQFIFAYHHEDERNPIYEEFH